MDWSGFEVLTSWMRCCVVTSIVGDLSACLLDFFDSEDGNNMFLWNVGDLLDYTVPQLDDCAVITISTIIFPLKELLKYRVFIQNFIFLTPIAPQYHSRLMHYATSWKVMGSNPNEVIGFFD
jgi:hypothetical protein